MKKFLLLALISSPTFAAPKSYLLDLKYTLKGHPEKSARLITNNGQSAEIADLDPGTKNGTFIKVTPTAQGKNQVLLTMEMGTIENGQKGETYKPQIKALEKESASMVSGASGEEPDFMVSVLAN